MALMENFASEQPGTSFAAIADTSVRFPDGTVNVDTELFSEDFRSAVDMDSAVTPDRTMVYKILSGSLIVRSWTKFETRSGAEAFMRKMECCLGEVMSPVLVNWVGFGVPELLPESRIVYMNDALTETSNTKEDALLPIWAIGLICGSAIIILLGTVFAISVFAAKVSDQQKQAFAEKYEQECKRVWKEKRERLSQLNQVHPEGPKIDKSMSAQSGAIVLIDQPGAIVPVGDAARVAVEI